MFRLLRNLRKKLIKKKARIFAEEFGCVLSNLSCVPKQGGNILGITSPSETIYSYSQSPKPNKNLKVALCLSGFLRTHNKTFKSYKENIIDRYNANVFIFAPNVSGISGNIDKTISKLDGKNKISEDALLEMYGRDNVKGIKLWDYQKEDFESLMENNKIPLTLDGRNPARTASAFYHIKECNELKKSFEEKNNFKYDVVIKARADLGVYSPLILENLDKLDDTIYYNGGNFDNSGKKRNDVALVFPYKNVQRGEYIGAGEIAFNDYINISSSRNIDQLSDVYDYFIDYYKRKVIFTPETLLAYHIIFEKKMNLKMANFTTCEIFRENFLEKWNPQSDNPDWNWLSCQLN